MNKQWCIIIAIALAHQSFSEESFVIEKKTIVSISSLKQDCAQEAVQLLGADQSMLLKQLGITGQLLADDITAFMDGTTKQSMPKHLTGKTGLEKYHAQIKKMRACAQQLISCLQEFQQFHG